jgi:hypothetical protein
MFALRYASGKGNKRGVTMSHATGVISFVIDDGKLTTVRTTSLGHDKSTVWNQQKYMQQIV